MTQPPANRVGRDVGRDEKGDVPSGSGAVPNRVSPALQIEEWDSETWVIRVDDAEAFYFGEEWLPVARKMVAAYNANGHTCNTVTRRAGGDWECVECGREAVVR